MKVLLAVDGSRFSDAAIETVATRTWPKGTTIRILTATETPLPVTAEGWMLPTTYIGEIEAACKKNAEQILESAHRILVEKLGKDVDLQTRLVVGPPKAMILDEEKEWGPDLIVLGSHGYNALERFLLGSVSQGVVNHATCSVEIARLPRGQSVAA